MRLWFRGLVMDTLEGDFVGSAEGGFWFSNAEGRRDLEMLTGFVVREARIGYLDEIVRAPREGMWIQGRSGVEVEWLGMSGKR
jgi:hypothetical protein